jgi:hypothetical protein
MRRRSWRSANAPASGIPKIIGAVNASEVAESASASAGFCAGSG